MPSDRIVADGVAAVILAAGAAKRMGRLKQLLVYRGRTLVENVVETATAAEFDPIVVVVGAQAEVMQAALSGTSAEVTENRDWESGMGSSIVTGVCALAGREYGAIAILLADQPLVTARHLQLMASTLKLGSAAAIAAQYNGTLGVPAIFKHEMTEKLLTLEPDSGARSLLRGPGFVIAAFPLPEAAVDIDTPEDFTAIEEQSRALVDRRK